MPIESPLGAELKELYDTETSRLQRDFSTTKNGLSFLRERSALAESVVLRLIASFLSPKESGPSGIALIAIGDFGRRALFPYSDIDLIFLLAGQNSADQQTSAIEQFSQRMSSVGLKANATIKTLAEFGEFDSENAESILSLLDCRFLAGDQQLFSNLRDNLIPEVMAREAQVLAERLAEMTRTRHRKFANTVFHLEPDVKDAPGGYRDYTLACWLAAMSAMERQHGWPDPDTLLSPELQNTMDQAFSFLTSVRCFLNFRNQRNDNVLTWDAQNDAAAQKIGASELEIHDARDWMRIYFGHARDVDRIAGQLLEEMPAAQSLFYRQLETWRTGFSDADFSVVDGLILFQKPESLADADLLFRTFRLIAQRGFKLSPTAEHQLEQARPFLADRLPGGSALWEFFQEVLPESHAADALRAMHSLHLLTILLPEFQGIEALAVRDVSHRFTVDEHTLQAIENLHILRQSKSKWDERFAGLLEELDQPELLYMAVLLHDTGKGVTGRDHIPESVAIAKACLDRFGLPEADRESVVFLIERHLDMGMTLRRDIFDPRTVAQFAEVVGTPDRLRMLCLLTHADIKAINPEALTPWKAEDLWQLYIGTANFLNRTVDERVRADANDEVLNHLRSLAPAAGKNLQTFLDGLPRRYLRTHPVDEILRHFEMANRLGHDSVQLALKRSRHWYELTVLTKDRPFLFATVAGVLAACGMNIGKAGAFSNAGGTVVDTFFFTDRFRRLEMNLPEWEKFKGTVHDALSGKQDMYRILRERLLTEKESSGKNTQEAKIQFDDSCSAHSTLIEVIAPDQPGLLYRITSIFSQQKCNIDIALIDTEGQTAIDVFYLTSAGAKLTPEHRENLRLELLKELFG